MLHYDKARACYNMILDSKQNELRNDLFLKAMEYAQIRTQCNLASSEQRQGMEQRRTLAHNAFIDACNIMSRNMVKNDEDNSWRAELGDNRKAIGDLACYIHCFLGIEAR
jgi:hypothetical protein